MKGHFAYFEKNADSAFFSHNVSQTTMNQNGRVNFFECLRPKLTIFEVKPSIRRLAYGTIARTHSKRWQCHYYKHFIKLCEVCFVNN